MPVSLVAPAGRSVEDELATGAVGADGFRESAIDDHDGVDAAIAPVWEDFVARGGDGAIGGERIGGGTPLAFVCGLAVDVEWLGGKPDDGEGVETASVSSHLDEEVSCPAVCVECALDDAIFALGLFFSFDGDGGGRSWWGGEILRWW